MNIEKFESLSFLEQQTLIISMHVRNKMENFHVAHLSDKQMAELNPIIRQAILEAFLIMAKATEEEDMVSKQTWKTIKENHYFTILLNFLIKMIPNYWEIPLEENVEKALKTKV